MKSIQPLYGGVRDDFGFREGEDMRGFTAEEAALWLKLNDHNNRLELMKQRDERRLKEQPERERQTWGTTQAGELLKKLGECFAEYKECLEQRSALVFPVERDMMLLSSTWNKT